MPIVSKSPLFSGIEKIDPQDQHKKRHLTRVHFKFTPVKKQLFRKTLLRQMKSEKKE